MESLDYAIPVAVKTIEDTPDHIVQMATMLNSGDALLYARSCRRYGADASTLGNMVRVRYLKDSDGKIGPKYS